MLSDSNIRKINRQISDELDSLWHLDTDEEKQAALERVAQMKSILDPCPTVDELVRTLKSPELPNELSSDLKKIFDAFRR